MRSFLTVIMLGCTSPQTTEDTDPPPLVESTADHLAAHWATYGGEANFPDTHRRAVETLLYAQVRAGKRRDIRIATHRPDPQLSGGIGPRWGD